MNGPQAVQTITPAQPNQYVTTSEFLQATQNNIVPVQQSMAYVDGNTQTYNMPQSGLANNIYLLLQAKIVVAGTVTGGTWTGWPNPAPFCMLKQMKFGSNVSTSIRNLTGISNYLYTRYRLGMDLFSQGNNSLFATQNQATLGLTNSVRIIPGGNIQAGTYYANWMIPVPIAYNQTGERALLNLQSNNVIWQLALTWGILTGGITATGGSNDLINGLTGSGLSVTATVNATFSYEYFENINANTAMLTSQYMSVFDQNPAQNITVGNNLWGPPTTELYTMLILQLFNNSVPLDIPSNASNIFLRYAANQAPYQCDSLTWTMRDMLQHRLAPPDGCIAWDFGLRRGEITRRDTYDAFSNANITDLKLGWTLPGNLNITGNSGVIAIMESLQSQA